MVTSLELRQQFIEFFKQRGHVFVPASSLVPYDDPTLLFTNAGMNQFKDIFLGIREKPYRRAVNSQKCIRVSGKHNDLEEVGLDTYHHTFFEMLGNWSFGDYYKKEAIEFAWELLTKVWGFNKEKLWATVYKDDDEAEAMWKRCTEIDHSHILRFDKKDNFWEMGDIGPCGPCSEIHIDLGEGMCEKKGIKGHNCVVNGGCARFIELWNLVFIQFNRDEEGHLIPLKEKHVDTGMGLERLVAVVQGKKSNYETDLFLPIIEKIKEIVTHNQILEDKNSKNESKRLLNLNCSANEQEVVFRVIADHIRALVFAISDGVMPSNEGRGYVIRRLLRRAARYGRKLGMNTSFIYKLVPTVIKIMGDAFPEIREKENFCQEIIKNEEENFGLTLDRGLEIFEEIYQQKASKNEYIISGEEAFKLYDTYGFPIDLTNLLAKEKGLKIDTRGFEKELEKQRTRSRESKHLENGRLENIFKLMSNKLVGVEHSRFVGYELTKVETKIIALYKISEKFYVVLLDTPFYAEGGGQVADKGKIHSGGYKLIVEDVQKRGDEIIHICSGRVPFNIDSDVFLLLKEPNEVVAEVNEADRRAVERNHTSTHLLHWALKKTLGEFVRQSGSFVSPEYLRFDFNYHKKLTDEQLYEIEKLVNEKVRDNERLEFLIKPYNEALKEGVIALFGEKYGDKVRVVKIGDFSKELCGGTHVRKTSEIIYFKITSEESISAGIRRISAITGTYAEEYFKKEKGVIENLKELLKVTDIEKIPSEVEKLIESNKTLEKEIKKLKFAVIAKSSLERLNQAYVEGIKVKYGFVEDCNNMDMLKELSDILRKEMKSGVGVLACYSGQQETNDETQGTKQEMKCNFLCIVTEDLISQKKIKADEIVRKVAKLCGGSGGGKPHLAMAGGKDVFAMQFAIDSIPQIIKEYLIQK